MQAVTEVLNKSRHGNSHLEMRQNPVTVAEHVGQGHVANESTTTTTSQANTCLLEYEISKKSFGNSLVELSKKNYGK